MSSVTDVATAASRRETRRKKIVDRGSDRLALISGRINSLPPESEVDHSTRSPNIATASPTSEEDVSSSISGLKFNPFDASNAPSTTSGPEIEGVRNPASDASASVASSMNGTSPVTASGTVQGLERPAQTCRGNNVNLKQISSAVDASRKTRLFCSIVVATFVVLSHLGFRPLQGEVVKIVINFRPLFMVLLTNLTIVVARVLLDGGGNHDSSHRLQNGSGSRKQYGWPSQVGNGLEVGLAMQKVINALVMDCSVYVVVVVCGLCFA